MSISRNTKVALEAIFEDYHQYGNDGMECACKLQGVMLMTTGDDISVVHDCFNIMLKLWGMDKDRIRAARKVTMSSFCL